MLPLYLEEVYSVKLEAAANSSEREIYPYCINLAKTKRNPLRKQEIPKTVIETKLANKKKRKYSH